MNTFTRNVFKKIYTFFNEFEDKLVQFKGIDPIMNVISMAGAVFNLLYKSSIRILITEETGGK